MVGSLPTDHLGRCKSSFCRGGQGFPRPSSFTEGRLGSPSREDLVGSSVPLLTVCSFFLTHTFQAAPGCQALRKQTGRQALLAGVGWV